MTAFGYFLSCEEFTPAQLVEQARLAERAGFTRLAISGHYHPWNDADGLVTMPPDTELIGRYRTAGGAGPVLGGVKVCWSEDRVRAVTAVHRLWPSELLPGELAQVLSTPSHFAQATELVTEEMVAKAVTCGDDPRDHADRLRGYVDAGFDEVYVGQIGQEQEGFFDFYREQVLPQFV